MVLEEGWTPAGVRGTEREVKVRESDMATRFAMDSSAWVDPLALMVVLMVGKV